MILKLLQKCKLGQVVYHTASNGFVMRGVVTEVDETLVSIWWSDRFSQEYHHNHQIWNYIALCCTKETP